MIPSIGSRRRRGVSAAEVVTVATIFVTMLGGMVSLGINSAVQYSADSSKMLADSDASLALHILAREMRTGLRATVGNNGKEVTVVMPAVNGQGDYDRFTEGASLRYYLDNSAKRLYRQQGTSTPKLLGDNVTGLQFVASGSQLAITLTTRQQVGRKVKQTVLKTSVTLRNEPAQ